MLEFKNIFVKVEEKEIVKWVNITFEKGKNYAILWENGSGKSSMSLTLAWSPRYTISSWEIWLDGKNISHLSPDEKSKLWIFLSFQSVPEIPWIFLWEYLRTIYNSSLAYKAGQKNQDFRPLSPFLFSRFIKKYLLELGINEDFLQRELNVGFSGGEKRKIEILQMKLLAPTYIILDEIDSGLDLDAFKSVVSFLTSLKTEEISFIIISHYFTIFDSLWIDKVFVMKGGKIVEEWGNELIEKVKKEWFKNF